MAIGFRAVGTMSTATTDPATAPAMPAGFTAGDMHLLVVGSKAATPPTLVTPSGYTAPSNNTITGGAGTAGATTGGPVRVTGLWRQAVGGDTGPAIDLSAAGSPTMAALIGFTKAAGEAWVAPVCAVAADTTGSTTSYDPAAAAVVLGCVAGDWIVAVHVLNDESGTLTVPGTLTVTGVTLSAVTNRLNQSTTTGNDGRLFVDTVSVTSGTDSAGPNAAIALTGGIANLAGASVFFRLRVTAGTVHAAAGGATSTVTAAANLTRVTPVTGGATSTSTAAGALAIVVIHAASGAATSTSTAAAALTISQNSYFPDSGSSQPPDNDPSISGIWGGDFSANIGGTITHVLVYHPASGGPASYTAAVHLQSSQALITTQASGGLSAGAWNAIALSSPVTTTATTKYTVSVLMSGSGEGRFDVGSTDHTAGGITAYGSLGRFKNSGFAAGDYPTSTEAGTGFAVGIRFTASAGGTTHAANGASTSTSTAAASLTRLTPVSGSATSTSTSAATLRAVLAVTGAATSTSIAAGTITATGVVAGAALSTWTAAGSLSSGTPIAGASTSAFTAAAALQVAHGVAGAATSTSTAAASITATLALTGSATSTSTVGASLTRLTPLTGAATSTSVAAGTVTATLTPTGAAVSTSTAAANLTRITPVTGAATSSSTTSAALTITSGPVTHDAAGAATSSTSAAASLTATLSLTVSATSTSTASAALTRVTPLTGAASSTTTTAATLTATLAVTGTSSSTSASAATLTLRAAVTADAISTSSASAELSMSVTLTGGAFTPSSAAAAIGFLHLVIAAALSASTTSANLSIDIFSPVIVRPGSGGTVRPGYGTIPRPYSDVVPRT